MAKPHLVPGFCLEHGGESKTPPRISPGGVSGVSISSEWGFACFAEKVLKPAHGREDLVPNELNLALQPASCHAPPGKAGLIKRASWKEWGRA